MKYIIFLLIAALLAGCAAPAELPPEPSVTETEAPVTEAPPETVPETTQPRPHPLQFLLDKMSTEERVGQLFLARCPKENAVEDMAAYHLGGYILFGRDFQEQTPDSLRETLTNYRMAAWIPPFFAVDEEGGTVCRVSSVAAFRKTKFPSPRSLFESGGLEAVIAAETEKAELLSTLGIQLNMAPVCDIALEPDSFMYSRSLGQSPETTGEFVRRTVEAMKSCRMGSVLKHFPGYGENGDTHKGLVRDSRTLAELESRDLIPFRAGIQARCGGVLVEHTIVEALDSELPASLSPEVHRYLREELGFTGVIITDDLAMQAITETYGPEEAAVLAVLAGNDLLCCTDYCTQYLAVLEAVQSGRIPMELLDAAVLRVLSWKQTLGMLF